MSFFLGFAFFVVVYLIIGFFGVNPFKSTETIGLVGSYTKDNLPPEVSDKFSKGLTVVLEDGLIKPSLASSWVIRDNGKTYIFKLKPNLYFNDGKKLTSSSIQYNFFDVEVARPDDPTIIFKLKEPYSPFLVTVSRPIIRGKFVGIGAYKVKSVDLNGYFVESIDLEPKDHGKKSLSYRFYPTEEALKTAFILGEISKIEGLQDANFLNLPLNKIPSFKVEKKINYSQLVTLFYNTQDKILSDKRLRDALSYSVNDEFSQGKRSRFPIPDSSWAFGRGLVTYQKDLLHAQDLFSKSDVSTKSGKLNLTIKSLPKYKDVANDVAKSWTALGINATFEIVESLPTDFQVFLGEFNVPKDPDQYVLWHSNQQDNITRYKNLRIDKLLEDGRQTIDLSTRKKIYADFQKYLLDDSPATFLFFPYTYTISK